MDGLVIESISLLTLLEEGDVPHYEQLKPCLLIRSHSVFPASKRALANR